MSLFYSTSVYPFSFPHVAHEDVYACLLPLVPATTWRGGAAALASTKQSTGHAHEGVSARGWGAYTVGTDSSLKPRRCG